MHRLPENVIILSLTQDRFCNQAIKFLGPTIPFLIFKNGDVFTQIEQKQSHQTPQAPRFRGT